jgi:PhnB protein
MEAMEFYEGVFGGTLAVDTFGDYGEQDPQLAGGVSHARLDTKRGFTLMASDAPRGMELQVGNTVAISTTLEDVQGPDIRKGIRQAGRVPGWQ